MRSFVLVYGEGPTMTLENVDDESADWFLARPSLSLAVRQVSRLHAQKRIDECRALAVAKDLETAFERMTGERVRVRAMKWTSFRTMRSNGREYVEQILHEIAS